MRRRRCFSRGIRGRYNAEFAARSIVRSMLLHPATSLRAPASSCPAPANADAAANALGVRTRRMRAAAAAACAAATRRSASSRPTLRRAFADGALAQAVVLAIVITRRRHVTLRAEPAPWVFAPQAHTPRRAPRAPASPSAARLRRTRRTWCRGGCGCGRARAAARTASAWTRCCWPRTCRLQPPAPARKSWR